MANVKITDVTKSYGDVEVMRDINLDIKDGEFVVFVGPSGCGKSTLLRMIAGLEEISGGTVAIGDKVMNDVSPSKRGVAMVFQTYALYPHMTVFDNMAFGLKQAKTPLPEIQDRVSKAAKILDIEQFLERTPKALSGGQRQRVAIGRAIVREPEVFLFDEPLSNLDAALRVQTRLEIARLHERLGATMIYVTHDQVEAMTLADKIVVLRLGNIEQVGSPLELYSKPRNTFVAQFIGSPKMNFFSSADLVPSATSDLTTLDPKGRIIGMRPEHLKACKPEEALLTAKVELIEHLGEYALVHLATENDTKFIAKMITPPENDRATVLHFNCEPDLIHHFDAESGLRV